MSNEQLWDVKSRCAYFQVQENISQSDWVVPGRVSVEIATASLVENVSLRNTFRRILALDLIEQSRLLNWYSGN